MSPTVFSARKKLSYPLYGADFDPLNQDFLLVGGGGGSTASGVPNRISLIDTSRRDQLAEVVDVELAKNEDSVTTLAVAASSESQLTAFAGINSSTADQNAGKNEHFRSFRLGLPARKRKADGSAAASSEKSSSSVGTTQALSRTALFKSAKGPKNDTYQRVLRLSPIKQKDQPRLAAVASGLAPENEIIVFQPVSNPGSADEVSRISLGNVEAADVDLIAADDNRHILAYCTDDQVFVQQLPNSEPGKSPPVLLYTTVEAAASVASLQRPKFRSLRFLTPRHILLLQNRPGRTGADLLVLKVSRDYIQGQITLQKRLNRSTKSAVGLDVCPLTASEQAERQSIVAVAGQDGSIELLTVDYDPTAGLRSCRPYMMLKDVHSGPLTKLVFATFIGPPLPVTKEVRLQFIRLASVGVDQNVAVHTLPLRPYPASSKTPRYVLVPPGQSDGLQTAFSVFTALVVVGIVAFLMQAFCEIRGAVPPTLGATNWLSPRMRELVARPYILADSPATTVEIPEVVSSATEKPNAAREDIQQSLEELVSRQSELETPQAIVIRDHGSGELSTELHLNVDVIEHEPLKKWDELSELQKQTWKRKLKDAGHWAENQGETVLKGILFAELAGVVADIARG